MTDGETYSLERDMPLAEAPAELLRMAGQPGRGERPDAERHVALVELDSPDAVDRFTDYLQFLAPLAIEGNGGNQTTFSVAAEARAQGISETTALDLMLEHWNPRCFPPWEPGELAVTVANGFHYGQGRPGSKHPAAAFGGVIVEPAEPELVASAAGPKSHLSVMGGGPRIWPAGLVKGLAIPKVGTGFIGGQSRSGKTFLALDLAGALATQGCFFGRRVREPVGVLYVAAEGHGTIGKRLEALRLGKLKGAEVGTIPIYVAECHQPKDLSALIDAAEAILAEQFELRLGAVFIDTIAALFNVADENDPHLATAATQAMEREATRHGCLVLGVSHHGKNPSLGLRGSSAWTASADLLLAATADINEATGAVANRRLALTKARDGETGLISDFTLRPVRIGVDEDGEPVDSAVIEACAANGPARRPAVHAGELIEAFDEVRAGKTTAPSSEVRERFKGKLAGRIKTSGGVSKALKAAMGSAGLTEITIAGRLVFQAGPVGFAGVVLDSS